MAIEQATTWNAAWTAASKARPPLTAKRLARIKRSIKNAHAIGPAFKVPKPQ